MNRTCSAPLLAMALTAAACVDPVTVKRDWPAMGRTAQVEVFMASSGAAEVTLAEMQDAMERVAATMNPSDPDSELSRLNREAESAFYRVSDPDLYRCLLLALDYARASGGAYDPTAAPLRRLYDRDSGPPSTFEVGAALARVGWASVIQAPEARAFRFRHPGTELDLGVVAEGFALDAAARAFSRIGSRGGRLRLGAQTYVWGEPPAGGDWRVEIADPRTPGRSLGRVRTQSRGISVAGRAEGEEPGPIDPRNGLPATGEVAAAIAIAHTAADAAAMSSALYIAGYKRGAEILEKTRNLEVILVVEGNGEPYVLASASLAGRFAPSPELSEEVGGRVRYLLLPLEIETTDLPLAR